MPSFGSPPPSAASGYEAIKVLNQQHGLIEVLPICGQQIAQLFKDDFLLGKEGKDGPADLCKTLQIVGARQVAGAEFLQGVAKFGEVVKGVLVWSVKGQVQKDHVVVFVVVVVFDGGGMVGFVIAQNIVAAKLEAGNAVANLFALVQ